MRTASSPSAEASALAWARAEFSQACFPDLRLVKRLVIVSADFAQNVACSIPEACGGDWARIKGAYRFFDHPSVTPEAIMASHGAATRQRMLSQRLVLAVQDTTTLDFSRHPRTEGLGTVGPRDRNLGLLLHTTLALTEEGVALGIVAAQSWTRPLGSQGKAELREKLSVQEKESRKWLDSFAATVEMARTMPDTRVVSVADREGDLYDLFEAAAAQPNVAVLVRSKQARRLRESSELSWAATAAQPLAGTTLVTVPRQPGKPARSVVLEVRFAELWLRPPARKPQAAPVKVWAVEAKELGAQPGQAIHWRLVTTAPVQTLEEARQRLRWYEQRWQVEEFHRVLKSGCGAEKRQLETRQRLEKILRLDMIVAWRVMDLTRAARSASPEPAEAKFDAEEIQVIKKLLGQTSEQPLDLREAVRRVAQLGGFIGRKSDGEPGVITLWRGLKRLEQLTAGYNLATNCG